ncbi:MAG: FkbM family methyltransferase [Methylophilaceae bacterium]
MGVTINSTTTTIKRFSIYTLLRHFFKSTVKSIIYKYATVEWEQQNSHQTLILQGFFHTSLVYNLNALIIHQNLSNMLDIKFDIKEINFFQLKYFANKNNIDFFEMLSYSLSKGVLFSKEQKLLLNFVNSVEDKKENICSQLFQDAFASFIIGDLLDKTFLEFGATDGISLSNSFMLESKLKWKGVLAEPSPQWHKKLKKNRPNTKIITDCIWKVSGDKLKFFVSDFGVFSTIFDFKENDSTSMPGNYKSRVKNGKVVDVKTISINEVMEKEFNGVSPSYVSIDTEGSEYEILNSLDFIKYQPVVFTIEHNYSMLENKIDKLMISNGYARVFRKLTAFDAWYVRNDALETKRI